MERISTVETARAVRMRPWISPPIFSGESAGRGEGTAELEVCAAETAVAVRRKSAVVRLAGKLKGLGVIWRDYRCLEKNKLRNMWIFLIVG